MGDLSLKRLGVTLLEIMTAVLILAMAFLPLIGVIGTSTKDSDVANSQVFAQTSARNILDTFLDDVPFKAISVASTPDSGDFAYTEPDEVKALTSVDYGNLMSMAELSDVPEKDFYRVSFLSLMGNNAGDGLARGELIDERGLVYKTRLFVFPIAASTDSSVTADEITFAYMPRPEYERQPDWYVTDKTHMKDTVTSPYAMPAESIKNNNAFAVGAEPNASGKICVMYKVLFQIYWINRDGIRRSLELFTMKADLK